MSNISHLRTCRSKTIRLLDKVTLDPASRARARASMEKAEWIADVVQTAGTALPAAVAWIDHSAGMVARRVRSALTKAIQH